jgi:transcriptional regulator with XRE-family HTH domain
VDIKTIVKNIRRIRENKNLSQAEVAKKAGISRIAYSNIETGRAKDLRTSTLINIANALDVKLVDFFAKEHNLTKVKFN